MDHRMDPVWYGLARLPELPRTQWRALVAQAGGDGHLLRVLFDRHDRSDEDRRWLIDHTEIELYLWETLASPNATAGHARALLERRPDNARVVAEALAGHPRVGCDDGLLAVALDAVSHLDPGDWDIVARAWPGERPMPPALVDAVLDLANAVPVGAWTNPATEPLSPRWQSLTRVVAGADDITVAAAAHRCPRLAVALLEYQHLSSEVLAACAPVLSDPDLAGDRRLSLGGRLSTLTRWRRQHPSLDDIARHAFAVAAADSVAALTREPDPELAAALAAFTDDPSLLTGAVTAVGAATRVRLELDSRDAPDWLRRAGDAVVALAANPHTPDHALADAPAWLPAGAINAIAGDRVALAHGCRVEQLGRPFDRPVVFSAPWDVPTDDMLDGSSDPGAVLAGLLVHLPGAARGQRQWLAARLAASRFGDTAILRALPANVVMKSPWHTDLAAALVAEVCGEDEGRWCILAERGSHGVHQISFAGLLEEIAVYDPSITIGAGAYRYCHACGLATPAKVHTEAQTNPNVALRRPGWSECVVCRHAAPPGAVLANDTARICPNCDRGLEHPAQAAVIACPRCDQLFFAPDLPGELRPRVDAVLSEQTRIAGLVSSLTERIDQLHATYEPPSATPGPATGAHPVPPGSPATADIVGSRDCGAVGYLSDTDVCALLALPGAASVVGGLVDCDLEAGHPGPHVAWVQDAAGEQWWTRFSDETRELVILGSCPAAEPSRAPGDEGEDEDEPCLLAAGHPGRHSWDLAPTVYRAPSAVNTIPAAPPAEAIEHFGFSARYGTDCEAVHSAISDGPVDFALVDVRPSKMFAQGHIPGAINLPTDDITDAALAERCDRKFVVVYGAERSGRDADPAAVAVARAGYRVKRMGGGITAWHTHGYPSITEPDATTIRRGQPEPPP